MKYVMKFGGTSVKNAGYNKICELLSDYKDDKTVIVVSALRGVTDGLFEATKKAEHGDEKWVKNFLAELRETHRSIVRSSIGKVPSVLEERLAKADYELEHVLYGILYLKEVTLRSLDYLVSFGERYSSEIAATTLSSNGFPAKPFTGGDVGIITDDRFGEATPIMNITIENIKTKIDPLLEKGIIPVVGGFSGVTKDGIITTFGRGGSDYTATIIANAVDADEVIIWSDVDGIMTSDPKIVPNAITVPEITYDEAVEMAVLGAKSLHPRSLEPVIEKKISVRLKNTFNPTHSGTLIVNKTTQPAHSVIKVISLIKDVGMLTIRGTSMVGETGMAAKFFARLGERKVNIMMISQSVSESNISIVIKRQLLDKACQALNESFVTDAKKIEIEPDISVIATVGEGMKGTPGVAARMFKAVADAGVNVRMIAQGSSELNVSFVVNELDSIKGVRALHREFIEKS